MALNEKSRHFFNDTARRDVYLSSSNYRSLLLRSFLNNFLINDDKWVEPIFKYKLLQIQRYDLFSYKLIKISGSANYLVIMIQT